MSVWSRVDAEGTEVAVCSPPILVWLPSGLVFGHGTVGRFGNAERCTGQCQMESVASGQWCGGRAEGWHCSMHAERLSVWRWEAWQSTVAAFFSAFCRPVVLLLLLLLLLLLRLQQRRRSARRGSLDTAGAVGPWIQMITPWSGS